MIPKVSSFFYNLSKITLAATGILFSNYLIAQPGFVANQGSRAAHGESTSEKLDTSSFKVTLPKELKELLTAKQQADLIKALKFQAEQESKHPYHTNTAKSISSPAAVPMMWGGIGIGGAVWNRYPTATKNSWSGNGVIALPIGNSDKYIGGSIGINIDSLGKNARFAKHGAILASLSKWLGKSTLIAVGSGNLIPWGDFKKGAKTYYGVVTQELGIPIKGNLHQMSISGGLGTGGYAAAGSRKALHDSKVYPFVNTSFNFTRNLAIAGDYYSKTFAFGASYNLNIVLPISIMGYASNLRHNSKAPSTSYGLRVALGLPLPEGMR